MEKLGCKDMHCEQGRLLANSHGCTGNLLGQQLGHWERQATTHIIYLQIFGTRSNPFLKEVNSSFLQKSHELSAKKEDIL